MTNKYLKLAKIGKNQWWRYLLSLPTILFFWIIIGSIVAIIFASIDPNLFFNSQTGELEATNDPIGSYIYLNLPFVFWGLGLYLAVRFIHQRSFLSLITPKKQIDMPRIIEGFGVYLALLAIWEIINYFIFQGDYQLNFDLQKFIIFLPIALFFTSIQTTVEELFFRGYLMQWLGLKLNSTLVTLISALIFASVHLLNPEVVNSEEPIIIWLAVYGAIGIFWSIITIKDNRLELAIATHAANNLYIALLVNYESSALTSPAIFIIPQELNPYLSLITIIIINAIAYSIFFRKKDPQISPKY
ncbi:MAG: lysostaphin resistance A-like protein [Prochloraceae cyanobacterium]